MSFGRAFNLFVLILVALSLSSLASAIGVLERASYPITSFTSINGSAMISISLRASTLGVALQACEPSYIRIVSWDGNVLLEDNITSAYWEKAVSLDRPGIYAVYLRGCGALRLFQASSGQKVPGLISEQLDPYEWRLIEGAVILASLLGGATLILVVVGRRLWRMET